MSNTNKVASRRKFLGGAVATGAAIAAGGMLTTDSAYAATGVPAKWDVETDVLVVGFGAGGSAATLEARAAGAKVTILERMKTGGGAITYSGGIIYMGGGTTLQKALGVEDTRDNMYNYLLAAVGDGANPELIGTFCDKSAELYDWLVAHGVKFKKTFLPGKYVVPATDDGLVYSGNEQQEPYKSIAIPAPRGHHAQAEGFSGHAIYAPLKAAVEASGAQVMYETLVKALVVNPKGRVVGVVATTKGVDKYIKAKRGVVLTTGGFGANKDMIAQHCPAYLRCGVFIGTDGDDGSGIRMGQSVGTDVRLLGDAIAYNAIYGPHESLVKGILVNDRGQRYVGEDNYGDWVGDLTAREYPRSFLIIDDAIMQGIPEEARKAVQPDAPVNGIVAQANSIAELASALKIPGPLLENTIKLYNDMSAAGEDIQFQKNKSYLQNLGTAPFYALDFSPKGIWFLTKGGLKINKKSQALDTNSKPVPGLYCAGTICSQIIAQHYPGSGTLNGQALTFGRIAGQNAAAEKPV